MQSRLPANKALRRKETLNCRQNQQQPSTATEASSNSKPQECCQERQDWQALCVHPSDSLLPICRLACALLHASFIAPALLSALPESFPRSATRLNNTGRRCPCPQRFGR